MTTIIQARDFQESVVAVIEQIMEFGTKVMVLDKNSGKQMETRELHPALVQIQDPLKRTLLYPKRGNNPFASVAETLWVLAGRDDMEYLSKFLPRAKNFSDDGTTWRAAYGKRLRKVMVEVEYGCGMEEVDQIIWIYNMLKNDPNSRQAVMTLWDPRYECLVEKTKDYPCNNWIHFMVRDDKLDCEVVIRSNDAIWGYSGINVYEWTVLQEMLAHCLGVGIGEYYHYASSLHIYERHYDKARELIESYITLPELPVFRYVRENATTDLVKHFPYVEEIVNDLNGELDYEQYVHNYAAQIRHNDGDQFTLGMTEAKAYCVIYKMWKQWGDSIQFADLYATLMAYLSFTDLKVACHFWVQKQRKRLKFDQVEEAINEAKEYNYDLKD